MNAAWADAERVLCVRLDNLGDVLMTTPAIRGLRDGLPDRAGARRRRHVTLLGSASGCSIGRHVPEIDETVSFQAPWVAAGRDPQGAGIAPMVERLAAGRYDAAVIFTCYTQSALPAAMLCAEAGIPLRLAHCRENPYGLLTAWVRDPEPDGGVRHEVERQLALVASVGAEPDSDRLSLAVGRAAKERIAATLAVRGIDPNAPYVVVHPGATASSRRWPAARFGEVAAAIVERTGIPIVITGSTDEWVVACAVCDAARGQSAVHNLCGSLALDDLCALIDGAALLLSNNSGPVHIAAACDTPVVDLYALTNPQHTPWRVAQRVLSHDVPCRNCLRSVCSEPAHLCLTGVGVDRVLAAALELLEPSAVSAAC